MIEHQVHCQRVLMDRAEGAGLVVVMPDYGDGIQQATLVVLGDGFAVEVLADEPRSFALAQAALAFTDLVTGASAQRPS